MCERLLAAVCVYVGATALASESIRLENLLHAGGTRLRFYPRGDRSHPRLCRGARAGEAYSDVAPAHVHDPDTMIMRQIAEQASQSACDIYRDFMRRTLATTCPPVALKEQTNTTGSTRYLA